MLPPLQDNMRTYTKKEIAHLGQCSVRTIAEDIKHLKIFPIDNADYGMNLYSDRALLLIQKLREHCRAGNTRESFIASVSTEIVFEDKPLPKINTQNNNSLIESALDIDPLADLEILQRISDNKWLLPTKRLAKILQVSAKTLSSNGRYNYCGFICTKELSAHGTYLWKIEANNS